MVAHELGFQAMGNTSDHFKANLDALTTCQRRLSELSGDGATAKSYLDTNTTLSQGNAIQNALAWDDAFKANQAAHQQLTASLNTALDLLSHLGQRVEASRAAYAQADQEVAGLMKALTGQLQAVSTPDVGGAAHGR